MSGDIHSNISVQIDSQFPANIMHRSYLRLPSLQTMDSAISVTIVNEFSDGDSANPAFDITVSAGSPFLTAGAVGAKPLDVGSLTKDENNGGIYQCPGGDGNIRGAIGYNLPGGQDILVIYFDNGQSLLSTISAGVSITATEVDTAAGGSASVSGTFTVGGEEAKYSVRGVNFDEKDLFICLAGRRGCRQGGRLTLSVSEPEK
jgi:hypothetical protein